MWFPVIDLFLALAALLVAAAMWPELKWLILGGWRDLLGKDPPDLNDRRRVDLGPPATGERRANYFRTNLRG